MATIVVFGDPGPPPPRSGPSPASPTRGTAGSRGGPRRSVLDDHRRAGRASSTRSASSSSRTRSTRRRSPRSTTRSRPARHASSEFLAGRPDGRFSVAGIDTQTVAPHLVARSGVLARGSARTAVLAGSARDLVGPDVRLYWEQAVYKQPHSAEPVLWHQDNGYTFVEPQAYLTCWIAITDATPENGCVTVMPGAHRGGTLAHRSTRRSASSAGATERHAVEVPVRAGQHRGVHVADAALHRGATRPTRCARRTSCSTRPTARSRTVRSPTDRGARPSRRTTSASSSRS